MASTSQKDILSDGKAAPKENENSKDETSLKDSQGGQKAVDDKAAAAENKNPKDETASKYSQGGQRPATGSAPGFPPNHFDLSAMSGLLNVLLFLEYLWSTASAVNKGTSLHALP